MTPGKGNFAIETTLKASLWDGSFYSIMVGLVETFIGAFVLAYGFSQVEAGLVAVLPVVFGSCIQLFTRRFLNRFRSPQRFILACAWTQVATLLGLAAISQSEGLSIFWIYAVTTVYWAAGLAAGPIWNAWMGQLVPVERRYRFFPARTRRVHFFTLIGTLTGGFLLGILTHHSLNGFSALFLLAALSRTCSALYLTRQCNPKLEAIDMASTFPREPKGPVISLWDPKVLGILVFSFLLHGSVHISGPFFSPYMLEVLKLSYLQFMVLSGASVLVRVICYQWLSQQVQNYGPARVLLAGMVGITALPYFWTVSTGFASLFTLQIAAGFAWSCFELSFFFLILESYGPIDRSRILVGVNFSNALGILVGTAIGGGYLALNGVSLESYHTNFLISTAARGFPLAVLYLTLRHLSVQPPKSVRPVQPLSRESASASRAPEKVA